MLSRMQIEYLQMMEEQLRQNWDAGFHQEFPAIAQAYAQVCQTLSQIAEEIEAPSTHSPKEDDGEVLEDPNKF
jgi:hypothetical protein